VLDYKYKTNKVNILQTKAAGASPFFKGFMWAAQAARMGYKWKIGNGKKVRFWEDNWMGNSCYSVVEAVQMCQ
jgi:hypothetical protein